MTLDVIIEKLRRGISYAAREGFQYDLIIMSFEELCILANRSTEFIYDGCIQTFDGIAIAPYETLEQCSKLVTSETSQGHKVFVLIS